MDSRVEEFSSRDANVYCVGPDTQTVNGKVTTRRAIMDAIPKLYMGAAIGFGFGVGVDIAHKVKNHFDTSSHNPPAVERVVSTEAEIKANASFYNHTMTPMNANVTPRKVTPSP